MILMSNKGTQYINVVTDEQAEELKKEGWDVVDNLVEYKNSLCGIVEPAREAVKGKPGRKPKSSLGGVHGNRPNQG